MKNQYYDFSMFEDEEQERVPAQQPEMDYSMFDETAQIDERKDYEIPIVEEMHPDIDWSARANVKNFGNSIDSSVKYLQEQYPHLEIQTDGDRYKIRNPEKDKNWKRLDPNTFEISDITDVGYDIGSGIVEGLATAGGFIGGGGVGAIPAAMASGAATETIRQGVGRLTGVNEEMDGGEVLSSGLISGAIPMVGKSLRGVGSAAVKKTAKNYPALMSKLSGIKKDVIENFNTDKLKYGAVSKNPNEYMRNLKSDAKSVVKDKRISLGNEFDEQLSSAGEINLKQHIDAIDSELDELRKVIEVDPNNLHAHDKINELEGIKSSIFQRQRATGEIDPETGEEIIEMLNAPDMASAADAKLYSQDLKNLGKLNADTATKSAVQKNQTPIGKYGISKARDIGSGIENDIKAAMPDDKVYSDYVNMIDENEQIKGALNSKDTSLYNLLKRSRKSGTNAELDRGNLSNLSNWAKEQGKDGAVANLNDTARMLESREIFENPTFKEALSFDKGKTPAAGIGGGLGALLGFGATRSYYGGIAGAGIGALGGNIVASPWAIKKTMENAPMIKRNISNALNKTGDAGYGVMKSAWEMNREQKRSTHQGF